MTETTEKETKDIILHLHANFVRNYAIRKAIQDNYSLLKHNNLWHILSNSCLDTAVINWCSLFGANKEATHWKNCSLRGVTDFENQILNVSSINWAEFKELHSAILDYRDRAAAHIDLKHWQVNVPFMHNALEVAYASLDAFKDFNGYTLDVRAEYSAQYKLAVELINK